MAKYDGSMTVGAVVAELPAASHLLKRHRIDYCCGGDRPLAAVLAEKGLDLNKFLGELEALDAERRAKNADDRDWRNAASGELIEHIIQTHHAYLERELPVLSEYTTKIMRVHGDTHPELGLLHRRFHEMKTELEQHLAAEENRVFPLLLEAERSGSGGAKAAALSEIRDAEGEHSAVGELLREMREITSDYALPPEACRTYEVTFRKLEELESDLFQHIHLENNVLFPRLGG